MSETIPEDIREKARAVWQESRDLIYREDHIENIAQALLSERKDTLEMAAKIAESHDRDDRSNWGSVIARAIRGETG